MFAQNVGILPVNHPQHAFRAERIKFSMIITQYIPFLKLLNLKKYTVCSLKKNLIL